MLESDDGGIPGRRAAFNVPRGVDEAVMLAVAGASMLGRKDGIRGVRVVVDGAAKSWACVSAGRTVDLDSGINVLVVSGEFRVRASSTDGVSAMVAAPRAGRAPFGQDGWPVGSGKWYVHERCKLGDYDWTRWNARWARNLPTAWKAAKG